MATNVPAIEFTAEGLTVPEELDVLSGVISDIDAAFGGGVNPSLTTPQGQLATSLTAIIGDKNDQIAHITNQVNPDYASGAFQDAIGRIYFLERKVAAHTAVTCQCIGNSGVIIPAGTRAQDTSGNLYISQAAATIPVSGTVDVVFSAEESGPIACPSGTLTKIYQTIPGWDSITNSTAGVSGTDIEGRAEFEARRQASVALNAHGSVGAIYAAVFNVEGVTDCYVAENTRSDSYFTGEISGTTLTVTSTVKADLVVGCSIYGPGVTDGTIITELGTGTGDTGTYTVNHSQTVASGILASPGIATGVTGYVLPSHSVYVAAVGGDDTDIAQAIWSKKDLGCDMSGNTTVIVYDEIYDEPQPSYDITFNRPDELPVLFSVTIVDKSTLPSNISELIKDAVLSAFSGGDGGDKARIGGSIYASRFYSPVATVHQSVAIVSIKIGTSTATLDTVDIGIDQVPTIDADDITVIIS